MNDEQVPRKMRLLIGIVFDWIERAIFSLEAH